MSARPRSLWQVRKSGTSWAARRSPVRCGPSRPPVRCWHGGPPTGRCGLCRPSLTPLLGQGRRPGGASARSAQPQISTLPRPPRCGGLQGLASRETVAVSNPDGLSHPDGGLGVLCHLPLQPAPPGMKDRASQVRSLVAPGPQPGPPVGGGASAGAVEGQNGSPPKTIAVPQATAKRPGLWTIPPPAWGYCRFGQRVAPRLRALCGLRLG